MISLEQNRIWRVHGKPPSLALLASIGSKEIARFGELKRSLVGISSSSTLSEKLQLLQH